MTSFTPNEVIRFLESKGWVIDHVKGSHFVLYHPQQKKRTVIPKHSKRKDLAEGTLLAILRQTGFTKRDLSLSNSQI